MTHLRLCHDRCISVQSVFHKDSDFTFIAHSATWAIRKMWVIYAELWELEVWRLTAWRCTASKYIEPTADLGGSESADT
jgi:hypothetical protein